MRDLRFSGEIFGERLTLQQIQKRTAKKLFEAGERIFVQSSNFVPFGVWTSAIEITKTEGNADFEAVVNSFEYYNCTAETGKYSTFYKID